MGYAAAAYLVVLAAMGYYWWSLASRRARLWREMPQPPPEGGRAAQAPWEAASGGRSG